MKRIALTGLLLGLGALCSRAGDSPYTINSQVLKENNFRNSLWMESYNVAGLAFRPFRLYNDLDISYDGEYGAFRPQQQATERNSISLNTSGSTYLGKFLVWGSFSFRNIFEQGVKYNAMSYEIEDDMPYFIADANPSPWQKQEYDLQAKIASPVLWDHISFGLGVHYVTKVGAKQIDPTAETYKYNIEITPSITVDLGKGHYLGINGLYDNRFEIADPSLNNQWKSQRVYIGRGLGEAFTHKIGDNDGMQEGMFSATRYGGGIQYGYSGDVELMADFSCIIKDELMRNNPKQPRTYGGISQNDLTGRIELLFGEGWSNHLWLTGEYRDTRGTEYTQAFNSSPGMQLWETLSTIEMSSYRYIQARLGYDHQFGASDERGYSWMAGAEAAFEMKDDSYYLPVSTYGYTNAMAGVFGAKQFKFRKSSLVIRLDAGYSLNLGGEYVYGGSYPDYPTVELYRYDIAFHTADWFRAGGKISYTINVKRVNFAFNLMADWFRPSGMDMDRTVCKGSFGIIF